ncbi:glucose-6-phosphate 1-epimerase [Glaciihabitans tibetensis]|uniref:Putative glucose-6-phosphate 1-epimerase n=1 Tax=Glaciihabitans tibetensis TaxID=1266600 RepID=A0A2T0V296_9MICO|nr:D-hexose-6-phosphate mutarotase [Glaciihabitans tibetensis]PRY64305.1 glucose-6-phosphate 1-epimerase [Glaciihabitans tibetensis]
MSVLPAPIPSLPASVQADVGPGGLRVLRVTAPSASAEIYLRGAHVASWTPAGTDASVIWMSEKSEYTDGVPLRGGVPICFPWFGANADDPSEPSHGFARLAEWELVEAKDVGSTVVLTLRLHDDLATRASAWGHRFEALYTVTVGGHLDLALTVTNPDRKAFTYEAALHTYFGVSDIRSVSVTGLEDVPFLDKLDGPSPLPAEGEAVRFVGETDRVYLGSAETIGVVDPNAKRVIDVKPRESSSTVVWNPWVAKAAKMADFGDDEWTTMVCVETCNVGAAAVTLEAGASHTMSVRYDVTGR